MTDPTMPTANKMKEHLCLYIERLEEALRECVRLSGADLSDGFPTWPELPEFAVQEVKELKEIYEADGQAHWQSYKKNLKYEGVLNLIACEQRPDGTYNHDREACRQLALEALGKEY
jgi:hypothetical protein